MLLKPLISALFFGYLCTSVAAQVVLDDTFPTDDIASFEKMHAAVSAEFSDPTSAQYKGLVLRNKVYKPAICGFVNSKNPAGGYGEFRPFAYAIESDNALVPRDVRDPLVGEMAVKALAILGCPLSAFGM